jgi:hypothetical protein
MRNFDVSDEINVAEMCNSESCNHKWINGFKSRSYGSWRRVVLAVGYRRFGGPWCLRVTTGVVLYGREILSLIPGKKHRLRISEDKEYWGKHLDLIVTKLKNNGKNYINELHNLYFSSNTVKKAKAKFVSVL